MSHPAISVIIPVYNVSQYLDKCLCSVTNQTLKDIEIIIVNDGSTDDSMSVIRKHAALDSRIKVIDKKNEGVVYARKKGVEAAQGEYIHYLDGDDIMEPESYELLLKKAIEENADMVVFEFRLFYNKIKKITRTENFKSTIDFIKYSVETSEYMSLGLNIHKRELYKNNILYSKGLTYAEDTYLTEQLAYYSKKITYLNKGLYNYIVRPNSATHAQLSDKKADDMMLSIALLTNFFIDKPEYDILKKPLLILYVKIDSDLYACNYFKGAHKRTKKSFRIIKKYPEIRKNFLSRRVYKLMSMYARSQFLGKILTKYYQLRKKI